MRAAFVTEVEKVEVKEIDRPVISDTEVLIKARTVGVCGSDLHLFRGTHPFRRAPAILGHEIAGEIVETGKNVQKFKVGDRVTVEPQVGCGTCEMCRRGCVSLCGEKKVPGTAKWIGAFSEYFNAEEHTLYRLSDECSYETGTLAEPLAVAVHTVNHARTKSGALVILGAGTIGQLILAFAKWKGYGPIIVTDTAEFNREFALKHGADAAFNPLDQDVPAEVKKLTGGGADLVIVAAGADNILDQACQCACKCGEVGIVAMITGRIPFYSYAVVFNEIDLYGAMCYEPKDFVEAVDLINSRKLKLEDYVTQIVDGIEKTQEGLELLSRKTEDVVKVLIRMDE